VNKFDAHTALARLQEGSEQLEKFGHEYGFPASATVDGKLVRRFLNAERQEILILRRYVLLAASRLEDAFNGSDTSDGLIAELRDAAKPTRRK
jgi:hypothetical protein